MADDEQKRIFSTNLNRLLSTTGKTQKEVATAIGVSPQTFNTWCQGVALPRMGKVQSLADYFGVKKSDLIDENKDNYYFNKETAQVAQDIFENKDLKVLFDAARDASPEDLKMAHSMLVALKKKEQGEDE